MPNQLRRLVNEYLEAFRGLPRNVWLLSLTLLVNRSGTMVLPFWAIYCKSERGFSDSEVGQLLAIYGIGSLIGGFLGGWLTTRIGSYRVQSISLFASGFGFIVLLQSTTFLEIAVALVGLSTISDAIRPAIGTATANACRKEQHPRAMALNRLAVNLGMSIGPAFGGFLAGRSFNLLFWCDAITCFVAGIGVLTIFGFRGDDVPVDSVDPDSDTPDKKTHPSAFLPWKDVPFAIFGFLNFVLAVVFFQLLGTYVLYFDEIYGLKEYQIGLVLAINTITIVLLEMVLVHAVRGYAVLRVIAIGFLFSGVGLCILPFGSGIAWAAFSVVLWTIGEMLSMPLAAAFTASRARPNERGVYMGAYSMTYSAAFVIAPVLGMWAYSINPNYVWYGGLLLTSIATAGTWWLSDRIQRPTRALSAAEPEPTASAAR